MIEAQEEGNKEKFDYYDDLRVQYWDSIINTTLFLISYTGLDANYVDNLPVVEREKYLELARTLKENEESYRKMILTALGYKFNK